ncbi:hypothetical protein MATL_G00063530 [Megalops atlanticus]|uniref:C3/C5 convertase n=1 Tax=Megalops atlanticus TaxID=7932 RepID=A0A9D3QBV3_MEGAT|nr:hypothetical protein MATL_G00063530 [Megalops atlanticus]
MLGLKLIILMKLVLIPVCAEIQSEIQCTEDVEIAGGHVEFPGEHKVGSVLRYVCHNHTRAAPVSWRVCGTDGKWSPIRQPAACVKYQCSGPVTLEKGWVSPRLASYPVGLSIHFQCWPGHSLYGASNITCLPTGKWSAPPAVCDTGGSLCGNPGVPAGGQRMGQRFEKGSRVRYTCYRGLQLMGPSVRICLEDGSWSGLQPQCEGQHSYDDPRKIAEHFAMTEHALLSPHQELHLYFIIKASRSVGAENVQTALQFVYQTANEVMDFTNRRRVDVIIFGAFAKNMGFSWPEGLQLTDYEEFLNGTGVNTGDALKLVLRMIQDRLPTNDNKLPAKNLIILITDGRHNMGPSPDSIINNMTNIIPNPDANLEIFVIGVGGGSRRHGLEKIASERAEPRAFYLPDYGSLAQLRPEESAAPCGFRGSLGGGFGRVFGGRKSVEHQWPWQVMVMWKGTFTGGGTIIAPRWVLTAAHVLHDEDGKFDDRESITVMAGEIKSPSRRGGSSLPTLKVEKIIVHEDYKHKEYQYDIALLKMEKDIQFDDKKRPVCLPCTAGLSQVLSLSSQNWTTRCHHQDLIFTGHGGADHRTINGFVTGWGYTEKGEVLSKDLNYGSISIREREQCEKMSKTEFKFSLTEEKFCANGDGVDACKGDSGGPFVIKKSGRWIQIGIVSYGTRKRCVAGSMGFYTSVPTLMPWIREKVGADLLYA